MPVGEMLGEEAVLEPVRDGRRVEVRLAVAARPQEPAALGREKPFVAIADVVVGAQSLKI